MNSVTSKEPADAKNGIKRTAIKVLVITTLLFSGCTTYDLDYKKLDLIAETKPKPDAIVGMWHRRATDYWGMQVRESYLFNRDGTGLLSYHMRDILVGTNDQTVKLTWSYSGNGIWKVQQVIDEKPYDTGEWRMAQGKLLRKGGFLVQEVLERVTQ